MLRHLPNILTSARILAIPALVWLAVTRRHDPFAVLLVASLVGDIVDGLLARVLHASSALGASLDSVADLLLFFTAAYGAWAFYPDAMRAHAFAFGLIPVLWIAEIAASFVRYGRPSSFHTTLARIAAYVMGIFIGLLFLTGFEPWLLYVADAAVTLATLEEFALLAVLPTWTADVRGLYWVLRARRAGQPIGRA